MGYGIAPNIKDEKVVCQKPCHHLDCTAMREDWIANAKCIKCGKVIEPTECFYYTGNKNNKWEKEHTYCD
jgi:hypothetical protein